MGKSLTPIVRAWGPSEDAPWASVVMTPLLPGEASAHSVHSACAPVLTQPMLFLLCLKTGKLRAREAEGLGLRLGPVLLCPECSCLPPKLTSCLGATSSRKPPLTRPH